MNTDHLDHDKVRELLNSAAHQLRISCDADWLPEEQAAAELIEQLAMDSHTW